MAKNSTKTKTSGARDGDELIGAELALDPKDAASTDTIAFSDDERRTPQVRERQHPALYGAPAVEVAERTIDSGEPETRLSEPTETHVKDFVTLKRDYDTEGHDLVHDRNIRAVRQYMMNQGLRPDAHVEFAGETDLGGPAGRESVSLRYEVHAVPAVIASDFDVRHAMVGEETTATERAEFDAKRETRLKVGYDALREGTAEADRPNDATPTDAPDATADAEEQKKTEARKATQKEQ